MPGLTARLRAFRLLCVLAAGLGCHPAAWLQVAAPTPDEVKAVYLLKFPAFVEWPAAALADATAPLVVGVADSPRIHAELARLVQDHPAQGRVVVVRSISLPGACVEVNLLFVGSDAEPRLDSWLAACKGLPVLTVSEQAGGLERGSMLNFVMVDQRVRFEASPEMAERAGLKLSSRLLAVAERIGSPRP